MDASTAAAPRDVVVEDVERRLEGAAVRRCLDSLTATQREAVVQAYYGGLTYREVAERLDAALPAVKSASGTGSCGSATAWGCVVADPTTPRGDGADDRPDVRDLLPAYALDAVDDVERRAVESLLAADPDARRELDEYRDVVAAFAVESDPPPALRDAVLARVAAPAATVPPAGGQRRCGRRPRGRAARPPPALDRARGGGGGGGRGGRPDHGRGPRDAGAVPPGGAGGRDRAHARRPRRDDPARRRGGRRQASVVAAGDDMYFRASDLPDAGDDRDYQLWVVEPDGAVVSVGVLDVQDGSTSRLVQDEPGVGRP